MTRTMQVQVTLLYPPQQTNPEWDCKPEGSLAYPSLAAALMDAGFAVEIFDACVGNEKDSLDEVFYRSSPLASGLQRTGVSAERILEEVADSDIVGITSIFTNQETMALEAARLIKSHFPEKLLISGGTNARSRYNVFLDAGFDLVCLSEAEGTVVSIAEEVARGGKQWGQISAVAFRENGKTVLRPTRAEDVVFDLDTLPMPAWELLPNERYWEIGRPHGATGDSDGPFRYASMMTSLGCVFKCRYCHISGEQNGSLSGPIGRFRVKSDERVIAEFEKLRSLGVEHLFLEDDTLFGKKRRGIELLRKVKDFGFHLWDINGINIAHLLRLDRSTGRYVPDLEVLDVLAECDFQAISLPFESGNQRILDYYASHKWRIEGADLVGLIQALLDRGIKAGGNYMLGYPDETREEIETTIEMARGHIDAGIMSANFMLVIPLPGTALHDEALEKGYIPHDFNPDTFNWREASMVNTTVPAEELEEIHQAAYRELNGPPTRLQREFAT